MKKGKISLVAVRFAAGSIALQKPMCEVFLLHSATAEELSGVNLTDTF